MKEGRVSRAWEDAAGSSFGETQVARRVPVRLRDEGFVGATQQCRQEEAERFRAKRWEETWRW